MRQLLIPWFLQDLVAYVHQQTSTNERQSVFIVEQSFTIEKQSEIMEEQSTLIQQLQDEVAVSLI